MIWILPFSKCLRLHAHITVSKSLCWLVTQSCKRVDNKRYLVGASCAEAFPAFAQVLLTVIPHISTVHRPALHHYTNVHLRLSYALRDELV